MIIIITLQFTIKKEREDTMVKSLKDKQDYVHKSAYDLLWQNNEILSSNYKNIEKNFDELQKRFEVVSGQLTDERDEYDFLLEKCKQLNNENSSLIGHRYAFSEIPNDKDGKEFINLLRHYLNDTSYKMRIRGQYLDKSKLGEDETWRDYDDGQPLSKSKCVRVYLDEKREIA